MEDPKVGKDFRSINSEVNATYSPKLIKFRLRRISQSFTDAAPARRRELFSRAWQRGGAGKTLLEICASLQWAHSQKGGSEELRVDVVLRNLHRPLL